MPSSVASSTPSSPATRRATGDALIRSPPLPAGAGAGFARLGLRARGGWGLVAARAPRRLAGACCRRLPLGPDPRDHLTDLERVALARHHLQQHAVGVGVVGHVGLVGLDLHQRRAALHLAADLHEPLEHGALLHRVGQPGHQVRRSPSDVAERGRARPSPRAPRAGTTPARAGGVGHRHVGAGHAARRAHRGSRMPAPGSAPPCSPRRRRGASPLRRSPRGWSCAPTRGSCRGRAGAACAGRSPRPRSCARPPASRRPSAPSRPSARCRRWSRPRPRAAPRPRRSASARRPVSTSPLRP